MFSKTDLDKLCSEIAIQTRAASSASAHCMDRADNGSKVDDILQARSIEALALSRDLLARKRI